MNIDEKMNRYFKILASLPKAVKATNHNGFITPLHLAIRECILNFQVNSQMKNKIMFIGNGASAAISAHMASDYTKAGGYRAVCFNDGVALTCLSNDFSYEEAFAKQVEYHAIAGDILIAISSSGKSRNILNAASTAKTKGCKVITLSGFEHDNPLRKIGDTNFWVDSTTYGLVEVTHHALLHCILDLSAGWEK